jgi:adenosylcobinamide-phosphate synthase
MGIFSLLAVLLLESLRPLPYRRIVQVPLLWFAGFLETRLNAGERRYGVLAWVCAAGVSVLLVWGAYAALYAFSPLLAWAWSVLVLYLTMGFRQSIDYFTDIQLALRLNDLPHGRKLLAEWLGYSANDLSPSEVSRLSIEGAFKVSHQHLFGILVCFVLLPGPCGAVLYRLAVFLAEEWGQKTETDVGHFGRFSQQAFTVIDWLPSRLTAAGFAIVGNFEDAIYCWRTQAETWPDQQAGSGLGIVLASAAGALGIRLARPLINNSEQPARTEMGAGYQVDVDSMQSAAGLIWRALWLWLLLLLLLEFASLVGA